jgi:hypothetical protein
LSTLQGQIRALLKEARSFVENFYGVDIALLVGGTSKLPMVRDIVTSECGGIIHIDDVYFDEMLATVRGVGFEKDFDDLVIKRPPYTIELRAALANGSEVSKTIHRAFDRAYPWWSTYHTALPSTEVTLPFETPISTVELFFISPSGKRQAAGLPPDYFRGALHLRVRFNVRATLSVEGNHRAITIRMPHFTQVGLKPSPPFDPTHLNAPEVYPDDN